MSKISPTQLRRVHEIDAWQLETDVAIVGFGGAGACAAIEAADAGAAVHIFEVASAGGGSTALSSAEIYMGGSGGTRVQCACGYENSTHDMFEYLMAAQGPSRPGGRAVAFRAARRAMRVGCRSATSRFSAAWRAGGPRRTIRARAEHSTISNLLTTTCGSIPGASRIRV